MAPWRGQIKTEGRYPGHGLGQAKVSDCNDLPDFHDSFLDRPGGPEMPPNQGQAGAALGKRTVNTRSSTQRKRSCS
jgi:hypothetical protein